MDIHPASPRASKRTKYTHSPVKGLDSSRSYNTSSVRTESKAVKWLMKLEEICSKLTQSDSSSQERLFPSLLSVLQQPPRTTQAVNMRSCIRNLIALLDKSSTTTRKGSLKCLCYILQHPVTSANLDKDVQDFLEADGLRHVVFLASLPQRNVRVYALRLIYSRQAQLLPPFMANDGLRSLAVVLTDLPAVLKQTSEEKQDDLEPQLFAAELFLAALSHRNRGDRNLDMRCIFPAWQALVTNPSVCGSSSQQRLLRVLGLLLLKGLHHENRFIVDLKPQVVKNAELFSIQMMQNTAFNSKDTQEDRSIEKTMQVIDTHLRLLMARDATLEGLKQVDTLFTALYSFLLRILCVDNLDRYDLSKSTIERKEASRTMQPRYSFQGPAGLPRPLQKLPSIIVTCSDLLISLWRRLPKELRLSASRGVGRFVLAVFQHGQALKTTLKPTAFDHLMRRMNKITIFVLGYPDVLQEFQEMDQPLSYKVWGSVIDLLQHTLVYCDVSTYEQKRLFWSLEQVSKSIPNVLYLNGIENLLDWDVVQVPLRRDEDGLATVIGFMQIIRNILEGDAVVRRTWRKSPHLVDVVSRLMSFGVNELERNDKTTLQRKALSQVLEACLNVVGTLLYDRDSLQHFTTGVHGELKTASKSPPVEDFISLLLKMLMPWCFSANREKPSLPKASSKLDMKAINVLKLVDFTEECKKVLIQSPIPFEELATLTPLGAPETYSVFHTLTSVLTATEFTSQCALADCFSRAFRRFVRERNVDYSLAFRRGLWDDQLQHRLRHYYQMSSTDESAVRLHEYTAVALSYATPLIDGWHEAFLGMAFENNPEKLNSWRTCESKSPAGVISRMLMFELEAVEESPNSSTSKVNGAQNGLRDQLLEQNRARRVAAAQSLQLLALQVSTNWKQALDGKLTDDMVRQAIAEEMQFYNHLRSLHTTPEGNEKVDDLLEIECLDRKTGVSGRVCASRHLLSAVSPVFGAMLGGSYKESEDKIILLEDVEPQALRMLVDLLDTLQKREYITEADTCIFLHPKHWQKIVGLLAISERFQIDSLQRSCEIWIMRQAFASTGAPWAFHLWKMYAGKNESRRQLALLDLRQDGLGYQGYLLVCLQSIALNMVAICEEDTFKDMLQDGTGDYGTRLCDHIWILIGSTLNQVFLAQEQNKRALSHARSIQHGQPREETQHMEVEEEKKESGKEEDS
ncbi:hypothetical protein BZG36_03509 [Bifiguratus adelaidae]|uniref:BTB domain-containing protein n=1 Tax=Bifiguratus adelaidae TaxID=1938954 RepID=A0A261XY03_9FUNG|nr:hypothetical protein BZG36_03509 [Bifiguratus adelaidae]